MSSTDQFEPMQTEETFSKCQEALYGKDDALVVHMWEDHKGVEDTPEGLAYRYTEITSLLGVMANRQHVHYDDTDYLLPTGFTSRVLSGDTQDGFTTLATSVVTKNAPDVWSGATGLLLLNPDTVFAAPTDAWSLYYEKDEYIPPDSEWNRMTRHQVVQDLCPARDLLVADAALRESMGGRLALTSWAPGELSVNSSRLWERLVALQLPASNGEASGAEGMLIDPFSQIVRDRAKEAFFSMINNEAAIREEFGGEDVWSEVVVDAGIRHIVGILIRNDEEPLLDTPNDWRSVLQQRPILRGSVGRSIEELELIRNHQSSSEALAPAAIIYQPGISSIPIVNFSLTEDNLEQLSEAAK